jgi:hypothetical protein
MELLDRYLQAVKKHLPRRRQDDIIAELRANMESQLEDKESQLGRPLTTGEAEDWLRTFGSPMMVAARYQPQQYLIGPALFPMYWYVLRTALFWATAVYAIVAGVLLLTVGAEQHDSALAAVLRAPGVLINVAVWVTLVFAAFELAMTHFPDKIPPITGLTEKWSPSSLPPLGKEPIAKGKSRSYGQAIAEIIFGFAMLVWLLLIPKHPFLLLGPGAVYLQVAPFELAHVWVAVYWFIVGINVLQLVWRCIDFARGKWQQTLSAQHIAVKALSLVPLLLLVNLQDKIYVTLKNPALDQLHYGATVDNVNRGIHSGLSVVCVIVVLQLIWDLAQTALTASRNRSARY